LRYLRFWQTEVDQVSATESAEKAKPAGPTHEARITVNGQFVVLPKGKISGLEIKEAAIAAGVAIQADFVLSEVRPNGDQKIIPDEKEITVKTGDEFWAIPGDDNS
jgi:hypothetical protein